MNNGREVVVISGVRTAIGDFGGALKDFSPTELGARCVREALIRAKVTPEEVGHVVFGNVLHTETKDMYLSRVCSINGGIPKEVPALTLNRLCGSGLQAIVSAAQIVALGDADAAVAGGAESMSRAIYWLPAARWGAKMGDQVVVDSLTGALSDPFDAQHMGVTAENVAAKYGLTRGSQDEFSVESHRRAANATGRFVISIVPSNGKQAYQGVVSIEGESIAQVLEHYMAKSEQLETRLWLASDSRQAAGLLLQKLPAAHSEDADVWDRATRLGETIKREELLALPAPEIIRRLYHQEDVRVFEPRPVAFRCSCSLDRVTSMLRMLGHDEVRSIIQERGNVEVDCEFCGRHYFFDAVDAEQVFAADVILPADKTRH